MANDILNNGVRVQWLGHATTLITSPQGKRIIVDPWVQGNPACPKEHHDVGALDLMLITHGHFDHLGDAVAIAKATRPRVIAIFEVANYLENNGVENTSPMNIGGTQEVDGIKVTQTMAVHSSGIMDGDHLIQGGLPTGFVITLENDFRIYHAGDTGLFGDMALIGEIWKPDLALLPIGDHFTMGPEEAARAARLLRVKRVIPIHHSTFPLLTGTPQRLQEAGRADGLEVLTLKPGETLA